MTKSNKWLVLLCLTAFSVSSIAAVCDPVCDPLISKMIQNSINKDINKNKCPFSKKVGIEPFIMKLAVDVPNHMAENICYKFDGNNATIAGTLIINCKSNGQIPFSMSDSLDFSMTMDKDCKLHNYSIKASGVITKSVISTAEYYNQIKPNLKKEIKKICAP